MILSASACCEGSRADAWHDHGEQARSLNAWITQLFLFDDVWAAEHRYLAKSLRRWFGKSWDPLK